MNLSDSALHCCFASCFPEAGDLSDLGLDPDDTGHVIAYFHAHFISTIWNLTHSADLPLQLVRYMECVIHSSQIEYAHDLIQLTVLPEIFDECPDMIDPLRQCGSDIPNVAKLLREFKSPDSIT